MNIMKLKLNHYSKMRYDIEKRTFLERKYSELKSIIAVQRAFKARFKTRNAPDKKTIRNIATKFTETGSVHDRRRKGQAVSEFRKSVKSQVQELVQQDSSLSVRKIAQNTKASCSTIHQVLTNDLKLKPYRLQERQELKSEDYSKREEFANWFLNLPDGSELFMIFSDEAYFYLKPTLNKQNNRNWLDSAPQTILEQPLFDQKVLVWCGVSASKLFGPYFFESSVNQDNYLEMLETFLWPKVLQTKGYKKYYFQQDGAPPHKALKVQEWLSNKFQDRFIGKDRWPPRSPDLNPCDFFLWGFLKDRVYNPLPKNLQDLRRNIEMTLKSLNTDILQRTFENLKKRCFLLLEKKGGHIE